MKNALIYTENNQVKVIFGGILKIIKVNELKLSHNLAFFEQLFREANVYAVQQVSQLTMDQLLEMNPLESSSEEEKKLDKSIERSASPSAPVMPAPTVNKKDNDELDFWIKSNAETAIIIDDLFTGREIAEGIPESLSIPHGRAVNLANINADAVKASRILRRLIENKTIVRCSHQEAVKMEHQYQDRLNNMRNARSMQDGNITVDTVGGKAEDFMYSASQIHNKEIIETDIMASDRGGLPHESVGNMGMSELMSSIEMSGQEESAGDVVPARRQLAKRPPVQRTGVQGIQLKKVGD